MGIQKFLPLTQCPAQHPPTHTHTHWFLQAEIMGTYIPGTGTLSGGGPDVGMRLLLPKISLPNFNPPHVGERGAHSVSVPLLRLDECGFFNSVVVRLLFNLISDGSE